MRSKNEHDRLQLGMWAKQTMRQLALIDAEVKDQILHQNCFNMRNDINNFLRSLDIEEEMERQEHLSNVAAGIFGFLFMTGLVTFVVHVLLHHP